MQEELLQGLRLKVPENQKTEKWYQEIFDYYIPPTNNLIIEDYDEMKRMYELINNDISNFKKELKAYCNPLEEYGEIEDDLIPYNKLRNKIEVLKGDYLKRSNSHRIVLLSAKAIKAKNDKLIEDIKANVNQQLARSVQMMKERMDQMSQDQQTELIAQLEQELTPPDINYKNYLSEIEIMNNKMLKYTYYQQEVKEKQLESIVDLATVDRVFTYNGWKHGKPFFKVCNTLHCIYHKSPNLPRVEKGDYFAQYDEITVGHALDEYINSLNKEKIEKLVEQARNFNRRGTGINDGYKFDHTKFFATLDLFNKGINHTKGVGNFQGNSLVGLNRYDTITRVHLEFKAYKKVTFYTYTDEYGDPITVMLDAKADIIPENADQVEYTNEYFKKDKKWVWSDALGNTHEAIVKWIPRRYEATRLGYDLFVDFREVPFQPDNLLNPFSDFELSYKGGVVNARNAKFFSLLNNALPYQFQIFALKHLENREIGKYEGAITNIDVDQIPDELTLDGNGEPIEGIDKLTQAAIIRRKTGTNYFSGTGNLNSLPNNQRRASLEVQSIGNANEIVGLQNLIQLIDVEMGIAMGIPPARESQVIPGTNVTDNQQSLIQSTLTTESYFFWLNKHWAKVLNEHLHNLATECRLHFAKGHKEHIFEYILPDNTKELLRVTPANLKNNDIGVYVHESPQEERYIEYMTQKILQNTVDPNTMDATSTVFKAITSGGSVEEINKIIQMEADKVRKHTEEQMKRQEQMQAQFKKDQMDLQDREYDKRIEEAVAKEIEKRKTEVLKENIKIEAEAIQKDIDKNSINDDIQKEQMKIDAERDKQLRDLATKERIEDKKIQSNEKIARMKPSPSK